MNKLYLLPLLLAASFNAAAEDLKLKRCDSGDCQNGFGKAVFFYPSSPKDGDYFYTGTFKNGQMDGEGMLAAASGYHVGSFESGKRSGYGIEFTPGLVNGVYVPDSSKWVEIGRWDDDGTHHVVQVHEDGATGYYHTMASGENYERFHPYKEIKDKWTLKHVAAYLAAAAPRFKEYNRVHDSMFPPQVIVNHHMVVRDHGRVNTARGRLENLCSWDCISSFKYYVTASNVVRGKLTIMPIGGFVRYQVRDENDKEIWEGAADQYWSPKKDGKYKFLIIFDVGTVYGAEPASGAQIEWSLRSETLP